MIAKPTVIPLLDEDAEGNLVLHNAHEVEAAGRAALRAMSDEERAQMQEVLGFTDDEVSAMLGDLDEEAP